MSSKWSTEKWRKSPCRSKWTLLYRSRWAICCWMSGCWRLICTPRSSSSPAEECSPPSGISTSRRSATRPCTWNSCRRPISGSYSYFSSILLHFFYLFFLFYSSSSSPSHPIGFHNFSSFWFLEWAIFLNKYFCQLFRCSFLINNTLGGGGGGGGYFLSSSSFSFCSFYLSLFAFGVFVIVHAWNECCNWTFWLIFIGGLNWCRIDHASFLRIVFWHWGGFWRRRFFFLASKIIFRF